MSNSLNKKRTILIVDDEMTNRKILGHILENKYHILYAEDGEVAYECIKKESDQISLILLDLMMPKMDGYQLLTILQKDAAYKKIPVVVLTSAVESEVKCLEMGALDFIAKPYESPQIILARVQRLIDYAETNTIVKAIENEELTGLYSLKFFYQYAKKLDNLHKNIPFDAMIFNIRRFHLINERFGWEVGNQILISLAQILEDTTEKYIVLTGKNETDQFYLYIEHQEQYAEFIDEINARLKEKFPEIQIALRVGIYPNVDKNIDMEKRFDKALHAANSIRDNQHQNYCCYDTQMFNDELFNEELTNMFDEAIKNKEFKIYFQPKFLITGETPILESAEALIRWDSPKYGLIPPFKFIDLYEKNGLITKLDRYVFEETVKMVGLWNQKYDPNFAVSVNLSRISLYDEDLDKKILEIVNKYHVNPHNIHLEITESAYTKNGNFVIEQIKKIRDAGFLIEMDDFGTGYSTFGLLAKMPFDVLKLDRSFILEITKDAKSERIVEYVIEIAKYLKVKTVAEGVEDEEQYLKLKQIGCDMIQGYYFSKPLKCEDFAKMLGDKYEH